MFPVRPILVCVALLAASFAAARTPLAAQVSLRIDAARADQSPLERLLASRVSIDFPKLTLEGLAEALRRQFSINVLLDQRALDDVEIDPQQATVSAIDLTHVVFEDALYSVLRELDLDILVRDEVLVITTPEEAENELQTRVYPVADLVFAGGSRREAGSSWYDDYDTLIELITTILAPDSWDDVGGAGGIECMPTARALVISQTRDVHRQIGPLLETLRRAQTISRQWVLGGLPGWAVVGSRPYTRESVPPMQDPALNVIQSPGRYVYVPRGAWQLPRQHD